jgi:divalent metal cation (Fe/Co/Zn/Cd) transporter
MFWSVAFAIGAGVLMARALRESLGAFITLAVVFGIVESFFDRPLALTFTALAVLCFLFYVTSTAAWKDALSPLTKDTSSSEE